MSKYKKQCLEFLNKNSNFIDVWVLPHHGREWQSLDGDIVAKAEMLNFLIAAYNGKHYRHQYCSCTMWNGVFSVCMCGKTRMTWECDTRLKLQTIDDQEIERIQFPPKSRFTFCSY